MFGKQTLYEIPRTKIMMYREWILNSVIILKIESVSSSINIYWKDNVVISSS